MEQDCKPGLQTFKPSPFLSLLTRGGIYCLQVPGSERYAGRGPGANSRAVLLVCLLAASLFKTPSKHICRLRLVGGGAVCITLDQGQLAFSVKSQIVIV